MYERRAPLEFVIDYKGSRLFFVPVLVARSRWCLEIGNMRELGEEPGKELEEFTCSLCSSSHQSCFCALGDRSEQQGTTLKKNAT